MTGVTVNNNLVIYNDLAQTAYLERIQDRLEIFNTNSFGAIILDSELIEGDFRKRAFYKIGGSIAHRDVNSESTVTPSKIGADEMIGVKTPWKYGPYASTEEAFKRRARTVEEFAQVVGQDMADAVMAGWVEFAVNSLVGSIGSNSDMVVQGSLATDGKKVLTRGMRTLGDQFNRLSVWMMDSEMYFDVVDQAIDNKLFEEAGLVVYGGSPGTMGKPVLVTDRAPSGKILGLQGGAARVTESQLPGMRLFDIDNLENLSVGFRAEGVASVEALGYSWDTEAGGANPTAADLADVSNWDKYATSDKVTAGFIIDLNGAS